MKKIKEWLSEINEPYKSQALNNLTNESIIKHKSFSSALQSAFIWKNSNEGYKYWSNIFKLSKKNEL